MPLRTAKVVHKAYPLLLGGFTLLFILRVLGQILVAVHDIPFLPPFENWQSGLLPYPMLLSAQIPIVILMLKIVLDFTRGEGYFVGLKPRTGSILKGLGCVYFLSMVVRYVVTMTIQPELRWFTGTLPIWFHMVLATFVFTLGQYQVSRESAPQQERVP